MITTLPPPAERFLPGQVLADRYRVIERVGAGGMGEVYRARDLKLGQIVALKFLPPELVRDPERLEGMLAEVRVARQVTHPNVCRVHDIEESDGTYFLSMEFVDGEDLASLLRRIGRLPVDKAVEIAREICVGLAAIHERGVLHRDLKPANVMIDGRGHARITDFGLAELQSASADPEMIVGTPAYMAPESFAGGPPTIQRDVYSLGLVLYELFTGKHPFGAATMLEMNRLRDAGAPPRPSALVRDFDPRIERATLLCLERDPARRPTSAIAVAAALPARDPLAAAVAAGETPSPEMVAAARGTDEGLRPAVAWSCLAALVLGLALLGAVAPRTRLVPALPFPEPPEVMAGRARALLHELGVPAAAVDRAYGYEYDESAMERIVAEDHSRARWRRLATHRPPVIAFWYRESPTDLLPAPPRYRVSYTDPPSALEGMAGVKLDGYGRLLRLDAQSPADSAPPANPADPAAFFRAAGLDIADFRAAETGPESRVEAQRRIFVGHDRETPPRALQVELATSGGRPQSFVVRPLPLPRPNATPASDPSGRAITVIRGVVRPILFLGAMFIGAWLARRNLRAGRGDVPRALRVAGAMMAFRVVGWALGSHYTPGSITEQLMSALAWGLYDFAYGWVSYVAIEPYVRRYWPRMLITWVRLFDGQHTDPRVGRDLLIGCLVGVAIALAVAAHQAAPALLGGPPGRPDNVGYVQDQLAALLGLRHQLAALLGTFRSRLVTAMGFLVILVIARLALRHPAAAVVAAGAIFVPLALPRGEFMGLNVALATCSTVILLFALLRFGLLPTVVGMLVHAALEVAPLGMGSWAASRAALVPALVLAIATYGFVRSLRRRGALRAAS